MNGGGGGEHDQRVTLTHHITHLHRRWLLHRHLLNALLRAHLPDVERPQRAAPRVGRPHGDHKHEVGHPRGSGDGFMFLWMIMHH